MYRDAKQETGLAEAPTIDSEGKRDDDDETSSNVESEALYNDDLGQEIPNDQETLVPPPPQNMSMIDFGDLPKFTSVIRMDDTRMICRRYPFLRGYDIEVPDPDDQAHRLPENMVAIYVEQMETGLRMLTSHFL